jgi:hypothetical protein
MSSFIINRIKSQIPPDAKPVVNIMSEPAPVLSKPISSEILGELLATQVIEPQPTQVNEVIQFTNIYDFITWYSERKDKFSAPQNQALETLVQARDMIGQGCACKTHARENAAFDYFRGFWMGNLNNDMLTTVLNVAGAKKIILGNFLSYPE